MIQVTQARSFFVSFASFFLAAAAPIVAQQPHDLCEDAILVEDGETAGSSLFTAGEGSSICGSSSGQPDVWYKYVAPYDGILIVNNCQLATYDSVLAIWNGCPANDGVELACSDGGCGGPFSSSVGAQISATQTYYIRVSGYEGDQGNFLLSISSSPISTPTGPDVVLSEMTEVANVAVLNDVRAYISDTHTCNIGDSNLAWGSTTPLMTWNAYRLAGGRLEQIGLSWVKNGVAANEGGGCGVPCQGDLGPGLAAGCKDVYGSSFNSDQGALGPRSEVDAFAGFYTGPSGDCPPADGICKFVQVDESDLVPDALYFFEVVFVAQDDAAAGNADNNASHKRVNLGPDFALTPVGPISVGQPALQAWRDHGLGINMPDPDVAVGVVDVSGEGRFHYAARARDLGFGTWRYEYAVFNLNSHRSARSFNIFVPEGTTITNIGFHDVNYHSGEPFDGTDWTAVVDFDGITWSTQTFAENPNANALRYATQYNFWFDANAAPIDGTAILGLFRPGDGGDVVGFGAVAPSSPSTSCPSLGDMNGDTSRDGLDIQHFIDCALFDFSPGANCDCGDMDFSGFHDDNDTFLFTQALLSDD
ncbi:MAG TPA: hypothetical protein VNT79_00925 [Phycisphaerae bacterium]|nr:hypothetical protein [Phycisphaerae bacterium]